MIRAMGLQKSRERERRGKHFSDKNNVKIVQKLYWIRMFFFVQKLPLENRSTWIVVVHNLHRVNSIRHSKNHSFLYNNKSNLTQHCWKTAASYFVFLMPPSRFLHNFPVSYISIPTSKKSIYPTNNTPLFKIESGRDMAENLMHCHVQLIFGKEL